MTDEQRRRIKLLKMLLLAAENYDVSPAKTDVVGHACQYAGAMRPKSKRQDFEALLNMKVGEVVGPLHREKYRPRKPAKP